jgi:hypothetical protein
MITADNSNVTLAEALSYHTDRATAEWLAADDSTRSAALIRATDYINFTYTLNETIDRTDAAVKNATMALAPYALGINLTAQASPDVLSEELVGVAKTTYSASPSDPYPFVTSILSPVASRKGGGFRVVKAIL